MRGQTRGNDSLTRAGRSSGVDLRTIGGTSRGHGGHQVTVIDLQQTVLGQTDVTHYSGDKF